MKKNLVNLMFAVFLGVALMLAPLMLLPIETYSEIKPKMPKSTSLIDRAEATEKAETLTMHTAPIVRVNWLAPLLTIVFGAIPAAVASIVVKRKLGI